GGPITKTAATVSLPAGKKGRCPLPGRRRPTINFAARGQPQANERNGPVVASERHERATLAHRSPTTGAWSLFVGSTPPVRQAPPFPFQDFKSCLDRFPPNS